MTEQREGFIMQMNPKIEQTHSLGSSAHNELT